MAHQVKPAYPSQKRLRKWPGGFVRLGRDGQEVFVIERGLNGRPWKFTLDVRTEKQALAELALFERDPNAYQTRAQHRQEHGGGGFRLDGDTLAAFRTTCQAAVERGQLTASHVNHTLRPYLLAWAKALKGQELRAVSLADLRRHLDDWPTATHKRIVALKALTAWARKTGKLARKDDPTLDLEVPPATPRPVADRGFTAEQLAAFYAALRDYEFAPGWGDDAPPEAPRTRVSLQPVRDVFVLRALTGMHHTEIERLARGEGRIRALEGEGEIAGTLIFPHKRGGEHVVSVGAQALAAARRLQAAGEAPNRVATSRAVARVVESHPELEGFAMERLRHTFVTLGAGGRVVTARGGGVPVELLGQVAGHTSTSTTRRHYLGAHIPPLVVLPLELRNEDDPA